MMGNSTGSPSVLWHLTCSSFMRAETCTRSCRVLCDGGGKIWRAARPARLRRTTLATDKQAVAVATKLKLPVFPGKSNTGDHDEDKKPRIKKWPELATTNQAQIEAW